MLRPFCRVKIHRAVVSEANLDYIGSMTIPEDMMALLDIREGEQVEVANIANGERWTTYAITGKQAGVYTLNGAAAHLGKPGDRIIIMVFALLDEKEAATHRMKVAFMNDRNEVERLQE
jgi:aspartate 1-decarboxylase